MESDEHFEPDCPKCPIVFLMPENECAVDLYSMLTSEIVSNGNLQAAIFAERQTEIQEAEGSLVAMLEKLNVIHQVAKEFSEKQPIEKVLQTKVGQDGIVRSKKLNVLE